MTIELLSLKGRLIQMNWENKQLVRSGNIFQIWSLSNKKRCRVSNAVQNGMQQPNSKAIATEYILLVTNPSSAASDDEFRYYVYPYMHQ